MTIRVLAIDGAPSTVAMTVARLAAWGDIDVVATARDAAQARELIRMLDPDVVTLDLEMPEMDALEFLEKLMRLRPTPVIVVASLGAKGSDTAARALALGAVDCYTRSEGTGTHQDDGGRLAHLVRQAAKGRPRKGAAVRQPPAAGL